jgi:hypothetical protein
VPNTRLRACGSASCSHTRPGATLAQARRFIAGTNPTEAAHAALAA